MQDSHCSMHVRPAGSHCCSLCTDDMRMGVICKGRISSLAGPAPAMPPATGEGQSGAFYVSLNGQIEFAQVW